MHCTDDLIIDPLQPSVALDISDQKLAVSALKPTQIALAAWKFSNHKDDCRQKVNILGHEIKMGHTLCGQGNRVSKARPVTDVLPHILLHFLLSVP